MKKLLPVVTGYLFLLFSLTTIHAQENLSADSRLLAFKSFSNLSAANTFDAATTGINENIVKKFRSLFQTASDDSWEKTRDGGYAVRFVSNGMQQMAFLDKKGNCESQIRYYTEKGLPADVRKMVRSTYYDYSIKGVTEVSHHDTTAYLVTIEDDTTWKIIRVVNGEMEVWKEFVKG